MRILVVSPAQQLHGVGWSGNHSRQAKTPRAFTGKTNDADLTDFHRFFVEILLLFNFPKSKLFSV